MRESLHIRLLADSFSAEFHLISASLDQATRCPHHGELPMNTLPAIWSKRLGISVMWILLILNTYLLIVNRYVLWVVLLTLFLIVTNLLILMRRVKQIAVQERVSESVLRIFSEMLNVSSQRELYQLILEEVVSVVDGGEKGSLMTIRGDQDVFFEATVGFDLDAVRRINLKLEETFLYRRTNGHIRGSVVIDNVYEYNRGQLAGTTMQSMMEAGIQEVHSTISSPIMIDGVLSGMLNIDSTKDISFNSKDVELVDRFSEEISKVIVLYRVFERTLQSAKYDFLTKTYNRGYFIHLLEQIFEGDEQDQGPVCILFLDLDDLKGVNDRHGHEAGDLYIKSVVEGVNHHLEQGEIIGRFGGDEFVALLKRDSQETEAFIKACEHWFREHTAVYKIHELPLKATFGFASYPEDGRDLHKLIETADMRMYAKKGY